jgi:predicted CXXCH cytochrome family protein
VHVFSTSEGGSPPEGFRKVYGHIGLGEGCAECHELSDTGKLSFEGGAEEVCGWCHGDLVRSTRGKNLKSVHAPVEAGKCLTCHAAHLSEKPGLPAEEAPDCRACHQETYDRLAKERYVHGPMNLGNCRLCHTMHSSTEQALLVESTLTICPQCHFDVEVKEDTPKELRPHVLIPQGLCGRCHFPHSSENPKMMKEPAARICLSCHPGKSRSFHEEKGFSIYVCQKCHDLHHPTGPGLIIESSRSLCLECHRFEESAAFTHSFVKEGGCFICHTFHESPLAATTATICLKCHGEDPGLDRHHGGMNISAAECTGCHQPHQSDRAKLLYPVEHNPFQERECGVCHEERAELLAGETSRELCVSCHTDKDADGAESAGLKVHPPVEENDCSFCHRSHASGEEGLLQGPQFGICVDCHAQLKKVTVLRPKSSHEAVLKGECSDCHDPHASSVQSFLRLPPPELCPSCHETLLQPAEGAEWESSHPPVEEDKCKLCHKPHTSRKPNLLRYGLPQACRPCHQEFFSHLEQHGRDKTHEPVKKGECRACHSVHGSMARSLLVPAGLREVCSSCHPAPRGGHHLFTAEEIMEKTGAGAEDVCLACHSPHSSRNARLLKGKNSKVCQGCHQV